MGQKGKSNFKRTLNRIIVSSFLLFTLPIPANSESQIPTRKDCNLVKEKQVYDYYDRQEAYDFGRKIQTLIAKKDLQGIYKNILISELQNGPRRAFIKNKSFEDIFPKKWVKQVVNSEINCDSIGWRGFKISQGLIWYDRMDDGNWTIKSINEVNQENFKNKNLIGWVTDKGIIPPSCFPTFGYFETPKIDLFSEKFKIKNKKKFRSSPGGYIGSKIPLGFKIDSEKSKDITYSIAINLQDCFEWDLANGFANKKRRTKNSVVIKNVIYQSRILEGRKVHNPFKSHYEVLSKVDLTECKKLASQLSNCVEAYLIKIGYSSGGSIGWLGSFYIFGKFDNPEGEYLVPLKIFNNRNAALNAIREAY